VKSVYLKSGKFRIRLGSETRLGYRHCAIGWIHRLVAEAFVPNPQGLPEIDHIDGNPSNNAASNLRWCTHQQNMRNPVTLGKMRKRSLTVLKKVVQQFTPDGHLVKEWKSGNEVARAFGVSSRRFATVMEKENPAWRGFIWKRVIKEIPRFNF
jgi:hypothetical protein